MKNSIFAFTMDMMKEKLFGSFEKTNKKDFFEALQEELKEQSLDSLETEFAESVHLSPIYFPEDVESLNTDIHFLKSGKSWLTQEHLEVNETEKAKKMSKDAISKGAQSIFFDLKSSDSVKLIHDKELPNVPLAFKIDSSQALSFIQGPNSEWEGQIFFDIYNQQMQDGLYHKDDEKLLAQLLQKVSSESKNIRALGVDACILQNAGADSIQELAHTLALAVNYIDTLTNLGVDKETCFAQIHFKMAIGPHFFAEIAKFKAFRKLWRLIQQSYEIDNEIPLILSTQNGTLNKSALDSYNNVLRNTTEAMSAIIGGCDILQIVPHNAYFEETTDFSRRIARNISTILKEESHLDKVYNISDGSYYIESLSNQFCKESWKLFQDIESQGGFMACFEKGIIQNSIQHNFNKLQGQFTEKKKVLVGVNRYENKNEILKQSSLKAKSTEPGNTDYPLLSNRRLSKEMEEAILAKKS